MAERPARDPLAALAQEINKLREDIADLAQKPLIIPILNADPGTGYPGNIWAYPNGNLNIRKKDGTVAGYTAVAPAAGGTNPTPPAQPISRIGTWAGTWGQAYKASGGFTGGDNSKLYQGNGDGFNGRQRSQIGFDYAAIVTALSGSNVTGVRIWLSMAHTWYYAGGTFWFGMHNSATKPGTWANTIGRDFVSQARVPNGGGVWCSLATEFGAKLRDGAAKGVTLQAPNDDRTYYGYAWGGPGTNSGQLPQLEITYVK